MRAQDRGRRRKLGWGALASTLLAVTVAGAEPRAAQAGGEGAAAAWTAGFAAVGTVRIVTVDADGDVRDTPVWIVTSDATAWVRTNDSRWLANIRRGSPIDLRTDDVSQPVAALEVDDAGEAARVEALFKTKYGWVQKLMSAVRISEPTVLRLQPAPRSLPVGAYEE